MSHPIFEANENSPYGVLPREEFYRKHQILHQESFMINEQNMKIYTQSWQPNWSSSNPCWRPKGFVAMVHGYCSESGWLFELNAVAIAKAGFLVFALDLQGHGYSDGPPGYISDMDSVVSDCIHYFNARRSEYECKYKNLPAFLYGESMGGAICILICLRQKTNEYCRPWNGMILSGPMCDISKKFKPIWPLEKLLPVAAFFAPSWRISCTKPPAKGSYKESWKKKLVANSPNRPENGKPPAVTAKELIRVCKLIRERCHELEVPMLIMHGENDSICDPEAAKFVFESAASKDKTMKIFPGMRHQLIGEPNQSVQMVFDTMMAWIEVRTALAKTK